VNNVVIPPPQSLFMVAQRVKSPQKRVGWHWLTPPAEVERMPSASMHSNVSRQNEVGGTTLFASESSTNVRERSAKVGNKHLLDKLELFPTSAK
jgi:hypothetical protein